MHQPVPRVQPTSLSVSVSVQRQCHRLCVRAAKVAVSVPVLVMSSWLDVTRKVVASAIASIAAELEQSVVDFNDAVQEMKSSREGEESPEEASERDKREGGCMRRKEMRLARESKELPKGPTVVESHPADQYIPASTRQVVTGSATRHMHMSTWPTSCLSPSYITTQPRPGAFIDGHPNSMLCEHHQVMKFADDVGRYDKIDSPCTVYAMYTDRGEGASLFSDSSNCHKCRMDGVLRLRLGEKRPGKVVRTMSSEQQDPFTDSFPSLDLITSEHSVTPNSPDSDYHQIMQLSPPTSRENQGSPKWLGYFTFALAQVTSAVWMMMDEPRHRRVSRRNQLLSSEITPDSTQFKSHNVNSSNKFESQNKYSVLKLEVHRPHIHNIHNEPINLNIQEDRNLLSPMSVQSNHSSESFEIIDTYMAEELPEFVTRSEAYFSGSPTQDLIRPEPFTLVSSKTSNVPAKDFQRVESSAELINFNFSSLISPQKYTQNAVEVAVSDDGSSSFDVLSDPGEDEFVLF